MDIFIVVNGRYILLYHDSSRGEILFHWFLNQEIIIMRLELLQNSIGGC